MNRARFKFHQPTIEELQNQKMNNVFDMLRKQQDGISALLKKYQNSPNEDLDQYFSHRSQSTQKQKQRTQISQKKSRSNHSFTNNRSLLPEIHKSKQLNNSTIIENHKRKKKNLQTIQVQKTALRKQLQKMYAQNKKFREKNLGSKSKLRKSRSNKKSRLSSEYSQGVVKQSLQGNQRTSIKISSGSPILSRVESISIHQTILRNEQQSIPKPIGITGYLNRGQNYFQRDPDFIEQPNSDEQEQSIPLSHYERQFRVIMTSQCVEEINYLYFSKNESIKDWSDALLGMFERHDKEILRLRTKMKYLHKFDDHFFAVDIYKN